MAATEHSTPHLPQHRLLRRIGRGSYGEVWIALNAMGKWCAVKLVPRTSTDNGKAYDQEFKGLKRYDDLSGADASLMPVKDVGHDPGGAFFYYAMELADDAATRAPLPRPVAFDPPSSECLGLAERYRPWTLAEKLRQEGRLSPAECIDHAMALASALEVIHGGRLVHRDIKPSNIIFVNGRPKLADVGLVTAVDATMLSLAGTSGFVPLHGAGTESGDLFALGKVLYLMATGRSIHEFPAEAAGLGELPKAERRDLAELRAVYDRACDVAPGDRHPSVQAFREELERLRRRESVIELRELRELRTRLLERNRRQRARFRALAFATCGLLLITAVAVWVARLRGETARQALLAEMRLRQRQPWQERRERWFSNELALASHAVSMRLPREALLHTVAMLPGWDAAPVGQWKDLETTSAAFGLDGRAVVAGRGTQPAMMIIAGSNRVELAARGEGKVCWPKDSNPLILLVDEDALVVRDACTGETRHALSLAPGEKVRALTGSALALSPDGTLAAASLTTSEGPGRTVVWNTRQGDLVGDLAVAATSLAFAPDGSVLALGEPDGKVFTCSTRPFGMTSELGPAVPPNPITALAFGRERRIPREGASPGVRWLLAAGDLGAGITVWDLAARVPRAFCRGSTWNVQSLAFHPDGQTLASAGRNGVSLWDATSGHPLLRLLDGCGGDTRALAFDPSGAFLLGGSVAGSQYAEVMLWELQPSRGIASLRGLTSAIRKTTFSEDGGTVAALADDWSLGVWDVVGGSLRTLVEVPPGVLADNAGMALSPDGSRLAFAAGRSAGLYSLTQGQPLRSWTLPPGLDDQLRFEPDGSLTLARIARSRPDERPGRQWMVYSLESSGGIRRVWNQADPGYTTDSLRLPPGGSRLLALARDVGTGQNLALGVSLDTGLELWRNRLGSTNTWLKLAVDWQGAWAGYQFSMPPARNHLVDAETGRLAAELEHPCVALGSQSLLRAEEQIEAHLLLVEGPEGTGVIPLHLDGQWTPDTITFSRDERFIAWGRNDGSVQVAEVGAVRRQLDAIEARVFLGSPLRRVRGSVR